MNIQKIRLALAYLRYCVKRPHRKGHGIDFPFLKDFVNQVLCNTSDHADSLHAIRTLREELRRTNAFVDIEDFGAGSAVMPGSTRKISDIVRVSSSSAKYGRLLRNFVAYYKPAVVIELGSCLGLGTMYLAGGNKEGRFYTIEGSRALWQKANEHYKKLGFTNIISSLGKFDDVLPRILNETGTFDLIYVDGNHTREATLGYFNLIRLHAHAGSAIIFDDIRWSEDMESAWDEICRHENVKLSLDLFNLGIVFFNPTFKKRHLALYF